MSAFKIMLSLILIFMCICNAIAAPPQLPSSVILQHQQLQSHHHYQQPQQQQQNQNQNQKPPPPNPYIKSWIDLLLGLREQMIKRSEKFDQSFINLLSNSKRNLHNMFADTYGMLYLENTDIFTNMFESLEQYYANGQVKLTKAMDNFFEKLYLKIFQVLNISKSFTKSYLECATEQLAHLKPFKDVPDKLIGGMRHSFVAARTFVQALNGGIDVLKNIVSLNQPAQCNLITEKLLKNTHVLPGSHQDQPARLPCLNFCEQVITKCIGRSYLEQLNEKWRGYVMALDELALKLSTSYNIETIISPMDVQISEAIMNFQENGTSITQQVFQNCAGRATSSSDPNLSLIRSPNKKLVKRATHSILNPTVLQNSHLPNHNRHNQHSASFVNQPIDTFRLGNYLKPGTRDKGIHSNPPMLLEEITSTGQKSPLLIDDIRNYMLSTKSFWYTLPNAVCTSNLTLGSNVSSVAKSQKQSNCFADNFQLVDVNSDLRYRLEIQQQVNHLETMRQKIESALAGVEIEWNSKLDTRYPPLQTIGGRVPFTTTTTTTTTPEPESDEPEEGEDDTETLESSGDQDPSETDDPETETTITEDYEETTSDEPQNSDPTSESPSILSTDASEPQDPLKGTIINIPPNDNHIDGLITPPEPQGGPKSSQTSSKLVINIEGRVLLASLLSVALLIVTRPHLSNLQMISHITDTR